MKAPNEMSNFDNAIYSMITDNGWEEAYTKQFLTNEQRERFEKIKAIYLEECLKDCNF